MQQFINGFTFTAGGITAFLCVFSIAMFCEFISKIMQQSGRSEIRNAIVDNTVQFFMLAERLREARSECDHAWILDDSGCFAVCDKCGNEDSLDVMRK